MEPRAAQIAEFRQIRSDLSALAIEKLAALDSSSTTPESSQFLNLAIPPAKLLLADEPSLHCRIAHALRSLTSPPPAGSEIHHAFSLHLTLAAYTRRFEALSPSDWSSAAAALPAAIEPMRIIEDYADLAPPADALPLIAWQTLCVLEQARLEARDVDVELVDAVAHTLIKSIEPPERMTESWLILLHALSTIALIRKEAHWARKVHEMALETMERRRGLQLAGVKEQGWALFATLWPSTTRNWSLERIAQIKFAPDHDALTALLTADAANSLARF